jgi:pimeloyl-ACP methyl ester carboxylesterase
MVERMDLRVDVSTAPGVPGSAQVAVTLCLPAADRMGDRPIVCFAKPGGGFSRGYYTEPLPGHDLPAQAQWHAERGWIFVSVDPVGVGDSSTDMAVEDLDYTVVTAAAHAAEQEILAQLTQGSLSAGVPRIEQPVVLGMGQSMGGSLAVVQQGRYHAWDGIAVLGFSAVHTHPAAAGVPAVRMPWRVREKLPAGVPAVLNGTTGVAREAMAAVNRRLFFHDDLGEMLIEELLAHPAADQPPRPWQSRTLPLGVISRCLTPGVIAPEAAAIEVPVLVALGERDVIADPKGEPRAYLSASSVDLFICPRMGHMHNFATTRELLWQRIDTWGEWVRRSAVGRSG